MKANQSIRTLDDFRRIAYGFRLPRICLTALDLDLFTIMNTRAWTIPNLAKKMNVSERGLSILCRNLASAGLLRKHGTQYRSSHLGQTMLNAQSPEYRGAYLDLMRQQWDDWSLLTQSVKSGKPVEEQGPEDPEYRRAFTWAMHYRSLEAAKHVAKQMVFPRAQSLLDVGGGPGTFALEFLRRNAQLQATVWDRLAALDVAREIAASCRYGSRLSYHAGDFLQDPPPGKFDVIWLSNAIHIYSPQENTALFRTLRSALNPGGSLLIQDTFLSDKDGLYPADTNLFAVTMLLFTQTGNTYHSTEIQTWLKKARLSKTKLIRLQKGTGDWEGVLIEARHT
ncbi:MAG: methyltransferase domain-containing protein [Nitrospirales bacterium]|nr:methyltransferase domain-containing protein [Nitrospirales bacterium]